MNTSEVFEFTVILMVKIVELECEVDDLKKRLSKLEQKYSKRGANDTPLIEKPL